MILLFSLHSRVQGGLMMSLCEDASVASSKATWALVRKGKLLMGVGRIDEAAIAFQLALRMVSLGSPFCCVLCGMP